MPTAIGYARVSTADQAETGESLELQQRKVRAAAEIGDYELVDVLRRCWRVGKVSAPT